MHAPRAADWLSFILQTDVQQAGSSVPSQEYPGSKHGWPREGAVRGRHWSARMTWGILVSRLSVTSRSSA